MASPRTWQGALRTTLDLDVVYRRTPENLTRLVTALGSCRPYLRGAPEGLPFRFDTSTLERGLNFTLTTTLGDLDLLGEVTGGGTFDQLQASAETVELEGFAQSRLVFSALINCTWPA